MQAQSNEKITLDLWRNFIDIDQRTFKTTVGGIKYGEYFTKEDRDRARECVRNMAEDLLIELRERVARVDLET